MSKRGGMAHWHNAPPPEYATAIGVLRDIGHFSQVVYCELTLFVYSYLYLIEHCNVELTKYFYWETILSAA